MKTSRIVGFLFATGSILSAFLYYAYGPSESVLGSLQAIVLWFVAGLLIFIWAPPRKQN